MSPEPSVGTVGFAASVKHLLKKLHCAEYVESFQGHPGQASLERLRDRAGDRFKFVVQASCALTYQAADPVRRRAHLPYLPPGATEDGLEVNETVRRAWSFTRGVAEALGASAIYLQTPHSFRPTSTNRRRLTRFADQISCSETRRIIWDGQGLWAKSETLAICRDLGWIPCLDPLVDEIPQLGEGYLRVLGKTRSSHGLSSDSLQLLVEATRRIEHCFVLLHTPMAFRDACSLINRLSR